MANRDGGMKASLSADDVGTSGKKPGKISANAIAKFESGLALGGSTGAIPRTTPLSGHASSSEMGSTSASQERIQPYRPHSVQICEPDEDMVATRGEKKSGDKNEKKRKSIWKWNPLKKVRNFFSRKKSSRRTKSCEDLPTSAYRPKQSNEDLTVDTPHDRSSPVVRTRTMPSSNKSPVNVLQELRKRQTSSQEEVRDEMSPSFASKTMSLPTLNTGVRSVRDNAYTQEAGISFDSDPNSSSLEGLQVAHDKIKAAPKRRRPPSRNRSGSATSTLSADSPVRKEQRTSHRRSKTDPKDLTKDRLDNSFESSSLSDILNNTIFERAEEEDEQTVKSPPSAAKENDIKKESAVLDDIMSRVDNAMARTSGPSKLTSREEVKKTEKVSDASKTAVFLTKIEKADETNKTTANRFEEPKRHSLDEKTRQSFTESVVSSKSESDILKAESSGFLYSEPPVQLCKDPKTSGERTSWTSTPRQPPESDKKETESQETNTTQDKQTQITTKPFKRGKSWSNNYKSKMKEFPIKQDNEEVITEPKKDSKPASNSQQTDKASEDTDPFTDQKDFRFSRTKSWSYGMKPGDVTKANQGSKSAETKTPSSSTSEGKKNDGPSWIAKANRVSKRISQLLEDDSDSSDQNETPTLRKSIKEPDKPRTSPKPVVKDPIKPKPSSTVTKESEPSEKPKSPSKPSSAPRPSPAPAPRPSPTPKPSSAPRPSPTPKPASPAPKPIPTSKSASPAPKPSPTPKPANPTPKPKPSSFVRNVGSLPRITGSGSSESKSTSSSSSSHVSTQKDSIKNIPNTSTTESKKTVQEMARSSFGNVKIEKCIVCGTTVYQMEKCKFDDSVLHRNCIKCSVCKRHLTVGNFVMAESKIYCKPHSQAVVAV